MSNENTVVYGSPNDIVKMTTLKISAASGNANPKIYANGHNQVVLEIQMEAKDSNKNVVNLSADQWTGITYLCFADSGSNLNWRGGNGWSYSNTANDYAREIGGAEVAHSPTVQARVDDNGVCTLLYYVYTDDINTHRIAVRVDPGNGTSFDTTDTPVGAQKSAVVVTAEQKLVYTKDDFKFDYESHVSETKNEVSANIKGEGWEDFYTIRVWYNNYYLTLNDNIEIKNYNFGAYRAYFISQYKNGANNQMIAVHPQGKTGKDTAGFYNFTTTSRVVGASEVQFNLEQEITFNPKAGAVCLSHMQYDMRYMCDSYFSGNFDMEKPEFTEEQYIEIYDVYGNYGTLSYEMTSGGGDVKFSYRNT